MKLRLLLSSLVCLATTLWADPPTTTGFPVLTTGNQSVSGVKNFTGTLQVGGVSIGTAAVHPASDFVASTITINGHATTANVTISAGDVGLVSVDNTSDATKNAAAVTLTNHTLDATNILAPNARMLPRRVVVEGDSLSCAGTQYWPPNFSGTVTGLSGSPNSYNAVASYVAGGSDATGLKPLTSWPEKLINLMPGGPVELIDFAYAGRAIDDVVKYQWQEDHLLAPRRSGVPSMIVNYIGINQLNTSPQTGATIWAQLKGLNKEQRRRGCFPIVNVTIQPSPLNPTQTVTVTASSTSSPTVTVSSVPGGLTTGYWLLGQIITGISGTTITLAGNANATIVGATLEPYLNGDYIVGGYFDVQRLAYNVLINANVADDGGPSADVVVDINTIAGLKADSNTPGSGQPYLRTASENNYVGTGNIHLAESGNVLMATAIYNACNALSTLAPSNTQAVTLSRADRLLQDSPWSHRQLLKTQFANGSSGGGSWNTWPGDDSSYISSGGTAGDVGMGYHSILGLGKHDIVNGGSYGPKDAESLNWGGLLGFSVVLKPQFTGTALTHTSLLLSLGKSGHTGGLLVNGDYAIGVVFTNPTNGVVNVYATASNGTTAWTSATPVFVGLTDKQYNVMAWVDGYGNLTVEVNRVRATYAGVAPLAGQGVGGISFIAETVVTATEAAAQMNFFGFNVFADE